MTPSLTNLTDAELAEVFAVEVAGMSPQFVVMKYGLYYRPKAQGYTSRIADAGMFTEAEAKGHEYLKGNDPVTIWRVDWPPFSTSTDALMPWVEKCAGFEVQMRRGAYLVRIHHDEPTRFNDPSVSEGMSLPRAICEALVIAAREGRKG